MSAKVLSPGFLTTVQDGGRTGFRNIGVSTGGALDAHALRVANLLVGNEPTAAGLEITLGGFRARFDDDRVVSWCGGDFDVGIAGVKLPTGRAGHVRAGEEIDFSHAQAGCRAWLAVSGGVDVPQVLGSRATDLRGRFGGLAGRTLQRGDVLEFAPMTSSPGSLSIVLKEARVSPWFAPVEWARTVQRHPVLRLVTGSEWTSFRVEDRSALWRDSFVVTPQADRMGVRLQGITLRYEGAELLSEAVAAGTIQVPPSGEPIILLPDCQTIGGYPRLAHVITVDLPIAAQLTPGDELRFREVSIADAQRLLIQRERDLELFRVGLSFRMR